MIKFENDDEFLEWCSTNPSAFVVNTRKPRADPGYFVLHRSSCSSLKATDRCADGAFTERSYQKWGASDVAEFLPEMRIERIADFSRRCSRCAP